MNYIVFDLEWNQGIAGKRESSHEEIPFEIIEIGAIKLDKRKNIIGQFQKIIKPSVYKKMPDIIEDMLHVDMKELKAGTPFPEAAEEFLAWCGEDFIFCSWGSLDLLELQRNMKYYQMPALAAGPICFLDIQKLFGIAFEHKKVGRTLEYAVDSLQIEKDIPFHRAFSDAYCTALVLQKIPAPNFIVFYNGTEKKEDRWVDYLSESYENMSGEPNLELKVITLNINVGHNKKLMEECRTLREYAQYVEKVRRYSNEMELNTAVERAVSESIQEGILKEFLQKNRAEVVAMSIFEYNEEEEKRKLRKAEYEAGVINTKKEVAISFAEMGLSVQQIAQGIKVEEKTVREWLNEKRI